MAIRAAATTYYVDINSTNATPPYTNWATASTDIQSAIDIASPGDLVLVNDGVYQTGGETINGYGLTNRVTIDQPITVQSVNGPAATVIVGFQDTNDIVDFDSIRCVYMTNGAVLSGFTLTNGATLGSGDGTYEQSGGGIFCESTNAIITNCVIIGNAANNSGGGANQGTFTGCTFSGNAAGTSGGGANSCVLNNCVLTNNVTGTVSASAIPSNSDESPGPLFLTSTAGGGAEGSTLNDCVVTNNSSQVGGGLDSCTANNCLILYNSADFGGGVSDSTLNNCTLVGNSDFNYGAAAYSSTLNNCIDYFNGGPDGYSTYNNCCVQSSPGGGGNISSDPAFVDWLNDDFHLTSNSPCINEGDNAYVTASTDLDGNPRIVEGTVDMGAYEYQVSIPMTAAIQSDSTNVAAGFPLQLQAVTEQGAANYFLWDFGDGTTATNESPLSHTWNTPGAYTLTLTVSNNFVPESTTVSETINVAASPVTYVNINGTNPAPPYLSWTTAATNIQDAVNGAYDGGIVLVTNGIYATGGKTEGGFGLTNRVAIYKSISLQSVNGPAVTIIEGYQDTNSIVAPDSIRCAYVTNGAVLSGFTLTNGATLAGGDGNYEQSGGGVFCESNATVTNCVIIGNVANNNGGGANQGALYNCVLAGNTAYNGGGANNCRLNNCVLSNNIVGSANFPVVFQYGGGAEASTLNDCVVADNFGTVGGGVDSSTANNCLIFDNSAFRGGGVSFSTANNSTIAANTAVEIGGGSWVSTLNNCIDYYNTNSDAYTACYYCCSDQNPGPVGDITNDPAFVDWPDNDFHLSSNSPCINSGDNLYVTTATDFDGNPRIVGRTVDIGAYEYQTPTSVLSYAWAQQYGLPTDGSVDFADLDGTGVNNWQKWIAGLNPTNPASVLVMLPNIPPNNSAGVTVTWQSVDNRNYYLLRSTNLAAQAAFWPIASNILGQAGATSYTDPSATNNGPYFYRVAIQ